MTDPIEELVGQYSFEWPPPMVADLSAIPEAEHNAQQDPPPRLVLQFLIGDEQNRFLVHLPMMLEAHYTTKPFTRFVDFETAKCCLTPVGWDIVSYIVTIAGIESVIVDQYRLIIQLGLAFGANDVVDQVLGTIAAAAGRQISSFEIAVRETNVAPCNDDDEAEVGDEDEEPDDRAA